MKVGHRWAAAEAPSLGGFKKKQKVNIVRRRMTFFILIIAVIAITFACAGRIFEKQHIFSNPIRQINEVYDYSTDTIIADDVWVFNPDGTFKAKIKDSSKILEITGTYSGDDIGERYLFFLFINDDNDADYEVQLDTENDLYSFIEWKNGDNSIIRYWLIE